MGQIGKPALGIEAFSETINGEGISLNPVTKKIINDIEINIVSKASASMIGSLNNVTNTGIQSGITNVPGVQIKQIKDVANKLTGIPDNLKEIFGDVGTVIEAIKAHQHKILPAKGGLDKFAETFSQIQGAIEKSKAEINTAVIGASEQVTSELEKVAGSFANVITDKDVTKNLTEQFIEAGKNIQKLGTLPLPKLNEVLLPAIETLRRLIDGGADFNDAIIKITNDADLENITEEEAQIILESATTGVEFDKARDILNIPNANLGNGIDLLNPTKASGGSVINFSSQVNLFEGDYGNQLNAGGLGFIVAGLEYDGMLSTDESNSTFPKGLNKVRSNSVKITKDKIGGGSGENGHITYEDVMGSLMGGIFDEKLKAYNLALNSINASIISKINGISDTLNGNWNITSAFDQISMSQALTVQLGELLNVGNDVLTQAGNDLLDHIISEQAFWDKLGIINLSENPAIENLGALSGFIDSLPLLEDDASIAIHNMLSMSVLAHKNSGSFERASNDLGVTGGNIISSTPVTPKFNPFN